MIYAGLMLTLLKVSGSAKQINNRLRKWLQTDVGDKSTLFLLRFQPTLSMVKTGDIVLDKKLINDIKVIEKAIYL